MKNKILLTLICFITITSFNFPTFAEENVEDLKKQIQALQSRIEELESKSSVNVNTPKDYQQWDPFAEMQRIQEDMENMFQFSFTQPGSRRSSMFRSNLDFDSDFDINETNDAYKIVFDTTGLNNNTLDIQITEHNITLKGEQSSQHEENNNNRFFKSSSFATFIKTIPLPNDADTSNMRTEKNENELIITLPKKK